MVHSRSRRSVLAGMGAGASLLTMPAWAQGHSMHRAPRRGGPIPAGFDEVSGEVIDLTIGSGHRVVEGRRGPGVAVNGSVPGPLIRLVEGQRVRLNVTNKLDVDSSVHWHGLLVPFQYDGVPGISFPGIRPGETFTYDFPVRQAGTYWYHSHSGLQEQSGHYGPMIIAPRGGDPLGVDRDYILLLSEFTARNNSALKILVEKHGVQLRRFPDELLAQVGKVAAAVVAEIASKDPFSNKVYASFDAFRRESVSYTRITEEAYTQARALIFG